MTHSMSSIIITRLLVPTGTFHHTALEENSEEKTEKIFIRLSSPHDTPAAQHVLSLSPGIWCIPQLTNPRSKTFFFPVLVFCCTLYFLLDVKLTRT